MSLTADRFAAFFIAANGYAPYPWQSDLVERIASDGAWPDINVPTGAGKSSVVDVHAFLVSGHAAGWLDVRPPRRLVLVAPRRVLVDDQYDRALELSRRLQGADPDSTLGETLRALRSLRTGRPGDEPALGVWRMRGGVRTETGWRRDPAACQIICATPQMWGSRLLFRGYGASTNARNLETGLLAHDSVVIIDEAHLHERLLETGRAVAERDPSPQALQVVAMSATRGIDRSVVTLSGADRSEPALSRRVSAQKRIERITVADWRRDLDAEVVAAAQRLSCAGTVGVFVNDVPTGLRVASYLGGEEEGVVFVCGRLRPADVVSLRSKHSGLLSADGNRDVRFLVSTQSLEVGVDLDLPAMVSMLAPAAALAQRAGRLNRSGTREESTFVVIEPQDLDQIQRSGPYEREELIAGKAWLDELGESIAPERVSQTPLPRTDRPLLPKLRVVDLDTLALTSHSQPADPDPELYLADPQVERSTLGIVARHHLGAEVDLADDVVRAALQACPPRQHEIATIPLEGQLTKRILDVVRPYAWIVRGADGVVDALRLDDDGDLHDGDVLVVPSGALICTAGVVGLNEVKDKVGPLRDVLDVNLDRDGGDPRDTIVVLRSEQVWDIVASDPVLATRQARRDLAEVIEDDHPALARRLRTHRRLPDLALTWCGRGDMEAGLLVVSDMRERAAQYVRAITAQEIELDKHQADVAERLARVLDALRLREMPERTQLLNAAANHDEGKRHPRFQKRMGADRAVLAKPRPGYRPDAGDGWRHEQLSAAFLDNDLEIIVTAAHHGRGRALFDRNASELLDLRAWPDWECPPSVRARAEALFGSQGTYELLRARLQRRIGPHRLAWLEALLRCADMQVSREEEVE